jgi:hypothetical protein
VLRLLALGAGPEALVVPTEAADWARGLVRRGIGLAALLRDYRLGHGWFWDRWSQALYERLADTDELMRDSVPSSGPGRCRPTANPRRLIVRWWPRSTANLGPKLGRNPRSRRVDERSTGRPQREEAPQCRASE